jgi:hypothetical protein
MTQSFCRIEEIHNERDSKWEVSLRYIETIRVYAMSSLSKMTGNKAGPKINRLREWFERAVLLGFREADSDKENLE